MAGGALWHERSGTRGATHSWRHAAGLPAAPEHNRIVIMMFDNVAHAPSRCCRCPSPSCLSHSRGRHDGGGARAQHPHPHYQRLQGLPACSAAPSKRAKYIIDAPAAAPGSCDHRHHAQPCFGRRAPHAPPKLSELRTRCRPRACHSSYRPTLVVLTCHGPGGLGDAGVVVRPHLSSLSSRPQRGLKVGSCPRGLQIFTSSLKHVRFAPFQVLNVSTIDGQHVRDGPIPKKRSACAYHASTQAPSCGAQVQM